MTTQEIEEALAALPPSDAIAQDMRECGYREEVIRAVVVAIDHARAMLEVVKRAQQVLNYPEMVHAKRMLRQALFVVSSTPGVLR